MPRYELAEAPDVDLDETIVLDSRGERITEAIAAEMAEHAIRSFNERRSSA